jgi:hypothetical protein
MPNTAATTIPTTNCRRLLLVGVYYFALILLSSSGLVVESSLDSNYHQQIVIEHPLDQQAKIGDQVILKCRIRNLRGEPQWCVDDFCLGVSKKTPDDTSDVSRSSSSGGGKSGVSQMGGNEFHLKGRPRYRIVGDRAKGEFNLLIEPVQLQDHMFFYCMATAASETIKAVKSKKVFLTVLSKFLFESTKFEF